MLPVVFLTFCQSMPNRCHFQDCKALLFTSLLVHVSSAILSIQTFTFTFASRAGFYDISFIRETLAVKTVCSRLDHVRH